MKRALKVLAIMLCSLLVTCLSSPSLAQTTPQIAKGNCKVCASACETTLNYCVEKRGRYGEETLTNALKDCVTACKSCGELLARGSRLGKKSAAMCVEACNSCAKSCEAFKDDNNMKACADECRKCAGNCQKVIDGDS
jgi:hypothetical protein